MNRFNYSRSFLISQFESFQQTYNKNQPYPHLVIDDLFEPGILQLILQEFSPTCNHTHQVRTNNDLFIKTKKVDRLSEFGRTFYYWLNSRDFLRALALVVNRERDSLIGDPYYLGAGIHELLPGEKIESHHNFLFHKDLPLICQFNLILCLNDCSDFAETGTIKICGSQDNSSPQVEYSLNSNRTFILPMTNKVKYTINTSECIMCSPKFLSIYYWSLIIN